MPRHDGLERLDHRQLGHPVVLERGERGVAEAEAADEDGEGGARRGREPDPGQLLLTGGELARHEEVVAELDLVDVTPGDRVPAPPEADLAPRGLLPVQLLDPHLRRLVPGRGRPDHGAMPNRTLACVWAHPDDDAYGAAGSVALHADDPDFRFVLVHATSGELGDIRAGFPATRETLGSVRRAEDEAAWRALGRLPDRHEWLGLPDGGVAEVPVEDVPRRGHGRGTPVR